MNLLFFSITTFVVTAACLHLLSPVAQHLDLLDKPCQRKQHTGAVPLVGGISVFIGALSGVMLAFEPVLEVRLFVVASALMVFIGVLDDKFDLSVRLRVMGQSLAASVIIIGGDLYISNLGNLFGFGVVELGLWGIPFTYVAVLAAMNAYNMVDGIDGLLGGLGLVAFVGIAILTGTSAETESTILAFFVATLLGCSLIPYILANLQLTCRLEKVFMGDAGSMFVGLAIVWLLAISSQGGISKEYVTEPAFKPVTALWLVAIPIMDMVAIVARRLQRGRSPFKPDRDHIHHILLKAGASPRYVLALLITIAVALAGIGILGEWLGVADSLMLLLFLFTFSMYCWVLSRVQQRSVQRNRARFQGR